MMILSNLQTISVYCTTSTYLLCKLLRKKSLKLKEDKNSKLKLSRKIMSQALKIVNKPLIINTQIQNKFYLTTTAIRISSNESQFQKRNQTNPDPLLLQKSLKELQSLKLTKTWRTKIIKFKKVQKSLTINNHKQF